MRAALLGLGFLLLLAAFWLGAVVANFTAAPTTGLSRDLYAFIFPRYVYAASTLAAGRLPLWNPYELCGAPFLAGAQTGVLNPLTMLVFLLLPPGLALHAHFLLHFLLAGAGMFLLCRGLGIGSAGAALAAVAWPFSPALTHSIYHPLRIACLVWLPAVFWLGLRLLRPPRLAPAALLALAVALQACAGYPEFAFDTGLLLALAVLLAGRGRGALLSLAVLAATAGVAVLLAGVQIVPTAELVRQSARTTLTARPALAPGPDVLATFFGLRAEAGIAYFSILPALYVGALPLVLAVAGGLLARPGVRGPFLAGALACVLALVGYDYLHRVPPFHLTRFALPWALLLPFFTAVLAGAGWDALGQVRWPGRVALGALGVTMACFVVFGTTIGAVCGVVAVVVAIARHRMRARSWLAPAAIVLLVVDFGLHLPFAGGIDPFPPFPPSATTQALLAALRAPPEPPRFLGPLESHRGVPLLERVRSLAGLEDSLMPRRLRRLADHFGLRIAVDMPLRLREVVQSKPLLDLMGVAYVTGPRRWAAALAEAGFEVVREPADDAHGLWRNPSALPPAFLVRRVRVVSGEEEAFRAVIASAFRPREEAIVEAPLAAPLPGEPLAPGEEVRVVRDTPEEVVLEAAARAPALLVLPDPHFPGWEAAVNGVRAEILRADFGFRAVHVPAGRHTITFTYRPRSVRIGSSLSALGAVITLALLAAARRRAR
jgi:hypothetical protein